MTAKTRSVTPTEYPLSESDISVAVCHPGNRADKVTVPLTATNLDVAVSPVNPYDSDIVLLDNPDRALAKEVLRKPLHDASVVYRMRGDVYRELELWDMHPLKKWAAKSMLHGLDGAIAVTDFLGRKLQRRANIEIVGTAGLAIDPNDWPTARHMGSDLCLVTLTNADYTRKIAPILEWAPIVEDWCQSNASHWHVCADGAYSDELSGQLSQYENVSFDGFVEPRDKLSTADVMLHPSNLDGQPNSILEGLASNLPVLTNDFIAFREFQGPIEICATEGDIRSALNTLQQPAHRGELGQLGREYVAEHHAPGVIGQQYVAYFRRLLSHA